MPISVMAVVWLWPEKRAMLVETEEISEAVLDKVSTDLKHGHR